jgi:single-strand DNA-binding protein
MNKTIISGNIVRDPDIRYSQAATPMAIARFTVAVGRRFKKDGEPDSDFLNCVAFGKNAEFIEKYFSKGKRIEVDGHLQTGSYEKDGIKRYTTDIIVDSVGFGESKKSSERATEKPQDVRYVVINDLDEDDLGIPF